MTSINYQDYINIYQKLSNNYQERIDDILVTDLFGGIYKVCISEKKHLVVDKLSWKKVKESIDKDVPDETKYNLGLVSFPHMFYAGIPVIEDEEEISKILSDDAMEHLRKKILSEFNRDLDFHFYYRYGVGEE
jgi:hypothetical protein